MPAYQAPLGDYRFVLHEALKVQDETQIAGYADLTADFTGAVLHNSQIGSVPGRPDRLHRPLVGRDSHRSYEHFPFDGDPRDKTLQFGQRRIVGGFIGTNTIARSRFTGL